MWFICALLTVLFWGCGDLFYKLSSPESESRTHLKIGVAVGMVMGIHGLVYMLASPDIGFELFDMVLYLPVSACYIISMVVGYYGLRYLALSISSPIQNSSGAIVAVLGLIIFTQIPSGLGIAGVVLLCLGVFMLSMLEYRDEAKQRIGAPKKYVNSVFAVLFPLLYCVIDAAGTFLDGLYLDEKQWMTEDRALLAYEFTFFIVGLVCLVWLLFVKKEKFTFRSEGKRYAAAAFETLGQFTYVFAMSGEAIIAAPLVSSYCVVSMVLSAIFLKEKLSPKKYIAVGIIVAGIILSGVAEA